MIQEIQLLFLFHLNIGHARHSFTIFHGPESLLFYSVILENASI